MKMTRTLNTLSRRAVLGGVAGLAALLCFDGNVSAGEIKEIHFLIPGGAGGGWDGTARGTGMVLTNTGLVDNASYENMSGAGGGKAIGYLIETADRQQDTLMVNSTPIVVRSLTKVFPYSFRDLTPIARTIGDFQAIAVRADSDIKSWADVVDRFKKDPRSVKFAGGSVRGDLDHLVPAMAMKAIGQDPRQVAYVPYDAGGKALAGLLSGETELLSTGFGEAIGPHRDGQIRIIAVSSGKPIDGIPTLKEQGADVEFANWRGFFAAPGLSAEKAKAYEDVLKQMMATGEWEDLRAKNGWQNLYLPGDQFVTFLEKQEGEIGGLMRELGFLK
jgi:putative tricarboxylic transport membrane protein